MIFFGQSKITSEYILFQNKKIYCVLVLKRVKFLEKINEW